MKLTWSHEIQLVVWTQPVWISLLHSAKQKQNGTFSRYANLFDARILHLQKTKPCTNLSHTKSRLQKSDTKQNGAEEESVGIHISKSHILQNTMERERNNKWAAAHATEKKEEPEDKPYPARVERNPVITVKLASASREIVCRSRWHRNALSIWLSEGVVPSLTAADILLEM